MSAPRIALFPYLLIPQPLSRKVNTIMSRGNAEQHDLAKRLATALRRFKREGGEESDLADAVGCEVRDFRRWEGDTKLPAHVLIALLEELPRHLADHLIGATSLRLICKNSPEQANALRAAATTSAFSADVAERMADGVWCHRDDEAAREHAQRVITELQKVAGE